MYLYMRDMATKRLFDCNKPPRLIIRDKIWKIQFYICLNLSFLFSSSLLPKRAKNDQFSVINNSVKYIKWVWIICRHKLFCRSREDYLNVSTKLKFTLVGNTTVSRIKMKSLPKEVFGKTQAKSSQIASVTTIDIRTLLECSF